MYPCSVIPMGSVTKSWTMAAIFRIIADGGSSPPFTLDTKVVDFANELTKRDNGTTLREIWNTTGSPADVANLELVTVRMLLGMTSGMQDCEYE
jgi:CubicO group peptidase (beta-lactamase class C family)